MLRVKRKSSADTGVWLSAYTKSWHTPPSQDVHVNFRADRARQLTHALADGPAGTFARDAGATERCTRRSTSAAVTCLVTEPVWNTEPGRTGTSWSTRRRIIGVRISCMSCTRAEAMVNPAGMAMSAAVSGLVARSP